MFFCCIDDNQKFQENLKDNLIEANNQKEEIEVNDNNIIIENEIGNEVK